MNFMEGNPCLPIAISYKRISISLLYDFVREKLKKIDKEPVVKISEAFTKELDSSVAKVMQRSFITVGPNVSLKDALKKAEARKCDLIIVKDELGNILGVINPGDFLIFLRGRRS